MRACAAKGVLLSGWRDGVCSECLSHRRLHHDGGQGCWGPQGQQHHPQHSQRAQHFLFQWGQEPEVLMTPGIHGETESGPLKPSSDIVKQGWTGPPYL